MAQVLQEPLKPHIVVEASRGRHHAYYLVHDFPTCAFPAAQRLLAARFGGDPSNSDLGRAMHLLGSYNMKGEPFLLWIKIRRDRRAYTREELVGGLPFLELALDVPPCVELPSKNTAS